MSKIKEVVTLAMEIINFLYKDIDNVLLEELNKNEDIWSITIGFNSTKDDRTRYDKMTGALVKLERIYKLIKIEEDSNEVISITTRKFSNIDEG